MQEIYRTYRNYALLLCLFMMTAGMCIVNVRGIDFDRKLSRDFFDMTLQEIEEERAGEEAQEEQKKQEEMAMEETEISHFRGIWESISSPKRTVDYDVLVNENAIFLDGENYEILCRIVEAEAGNEDEKGRMLVARVVMNRVESSRFPDTVKEVVFQKNGGICQFSPVANGSYYKVSVSDKTREAVDKVLRGEDDSRGALYFVNRKAADAEYLDWFDTKCTPLFSYGRHEFFS